MNNITTIFFLLFPFYFKLLHKSMANETHQTKYVGVSFHLSAFLNPLYFSVKQVFESLLPAIIVLKKYSLNHYVKRREKRITNSFSCFKTEQYCPHPLHWKPIEWGSPRAYIERRASDKDKAAFIQNWWNLDNELLRTPLTSTNGKWRYLYVNGMETTWKRQWKKGREWDPCSLISLNVTFQYKYNLLMLKIKQWDNKIFPA